jgi:hypothetical protein
MRDSALALFVFLVFLGIVIAAGWMHFYGPCEAFTLQDAPLRCLKGTAP